jgi:hypothetical protein
MQVAFQLKREATTSPSRERSVEDIADQRRARGEENITVDGSAEGRSLRDGFAGDDFAGEGTVGRLSLGGKTAGGRASLVEGSSGERNANRRVKRWRVMAAAFRTIADELIAEAEDLEKAIQDDEPRKI